MLGTEVFGSHQTHSILDGIFEKRLRIYKKKKKKKKKKDFNEPEKIFLFSWINLLCSRNP